jgi:hypothetical protein
VGQKDIIFGCFAFDSVLFGCEQLQQHEEINNTHLHSFILFGVFIYMLFSFHTLDK